MTWEEVSRTENEVLSRTVVEGGWLYRYMQRQGDLHGGFTWSISLAFVPTPPAAP